MAKSPKFDALGEHAVNATAQPSATWNRAAGMVIAGRAYIDEADKTAIDMEAKWGADRLRLLVSPELREKFDRQRYLFNQAIWHGDLEGVRIQSQRMIRAWLAADAEATGKGEQRLSPEVWEVALEGGSVAALVRDNASAHHVVASGRAVAVYTMEEIGRLLGGYRELARVKEVFPGAQVTAVRKSVDDPLLNVHDTSRALDDEVPW